MQDTYTRIMKIAEKITNDYYIKKNSYLPTGQLYKIINNIFNGFDSFEYTIYIHNDEYDVLPNYIICYNNIPFEDNKDPQFLSTSKVLVDGKPIRIINLPMCLLTDVNSPKKIKDAIISVLTILYNDVFDTTGIKSDDIYIRYTAYYILKAYYHTTTDPIEYIANPSSEQFDMVKSIFEAAYEDVFEEVVDNMKLNLYITEYSTNN